MFPKNHKSLNLILQFDLKNNKLNVMKYFDYILHTKYDKKLSE